MSKREIKFRAWHKGEPSKGRFRGIEPEMLYDNKPGDCLVWLSQGQPVELMQYTGLKDKNGVEIYEGDIFKGDEPGDAIVIDWNEEKAAFGVNLYGYDSHTGEGGQEAYDSEISLIDVDFMEVSSLIDCEVIGNIHSNPELI